MKANILLGALLCVAATGCTLELNDYACSSDADCVTFGRVCVEGYCALDETSDGSVDVPDSDVEVDANDVTDVASTDADTSADVETTDDVVRNDLGGEDTVDEDAGDDVDDAGDDVDDAGDDADADADVETDVVPDDVADAVDDTVDDTDAESDADDADDAGDVTADVTLNECGGSNVLESVVGTTCGECMDGEVVCDGLEATRCEGASTRNACGGCDELANAPGASCGECGLGEFVCDGDNALRCDDPGAANDCGGCGTLAQDPGSACGPCGRDTWLCDGTENVDCSGAGDVCGDEIGDSCERDADCAFGLECSNDVCVAAGWVYAPPGSMRMGSPTEEVGRSTTIGVETAHNVQLTRGYYIERFETTRGDWLDLGAAPTWSDSCGDDCPASGLTWWDAALFANLASFAEGYPECYVLEGCSTTPGGVTECLAWGIDAAERTPYNCTGYRLPTEAEWEYAYRAGTSTAFHNGPSSDAGIDPNATAIGHYAGSSGRISPVGQLLPNAWELYDMAGNVWEWTDGDYYSYGGNEVDPHHSAARAHYSTPVRRGGGATSAASALRGASRSWQERGVTVGTNGMRLVRSAWPEHCSNDLLDAAAEDAVDCGNACPPCERFEGDRCLDDAQCVEGYCSANVCTPDGFVTVLPGTFLMGSLPGEPAREADEERHSVTLTRRFWMATTEVTQGEFERLMEFNRSAFTTCGADCPVERVSWLEANAYLALLNAESGLETCVDPADGSLVGDSSPYACDGFRLPTEAEWELACRAGTTSHFYSGNLTNYECADPALNDTAWYCGNAGGTTHAVASLEPNPNGLYDMAGNVWEWVYDGYDAFAADDVVDPVGATDETARVFRGGAFNNVSHFLRCASRAAGFQTAITESNVGFRIARTVPE